jgi:hypothetical protein
MCEGGCHTQGTMRTYFLVTDDHWPRRFPELWRLGWMCVCVCLSICLYISVFPGKEARGEIITSGFLGQNWISCSAGLLTPRRGAPPGKFLKMELPPIYEFQYRAKKNCNFEHMREDILSDNSWCNKKFSSLFRLKNRFLNLLFMLKRHANVVNFYYKCRLRVHIFHALWTFFHFGFRLLVQFDCGESTKKTLGNLPPKKSNSPQ